MNRFKKMIKEVHNIMCNETSEIIDATKNAFIDISNDENSKTLLSNLFVGFGTALLITGILIRIS